MGSFELRIILADMYDGTGTSLNQGFAPVPVSSGNATVTDNNDGTLDVDVLYSWNATQTILYSSVRYVKAGVSIITSNDDEDIITPYSGVASGKSAFAEASVNVWVPFYYIHIGPETGNRGGIYSIVNPTTGAFTPANVAFTHSSVLFPGNGYYLEEGKLNIYSDSLMPYYNSFSGDEGNQTFALHVKIPGHISRRVPDVQLDSWEPTSSGSGILRFKTNGTAQRRYFTKSGSLWKPL